MASATATMASSWPTTRSCSLVFHLQQLVALALHQLGHRDAGGARHHLGDLLGADHRAQQLRAAACRPWRPWPCRFPWPAPPSGVFSSSGSLPYCSSATLLKSPLRLSSSIWKRMRSISSLTCAEPCAAAFSAFQISSRSAYSRCELGDLFLDQAQALAARPRPSPSHRLALDLQLDQPAVELVHHLGLGVDLDLDLGRGLVDQVDRLVGQEAVGDVAVAQLGRGDDRRVGDLHAVVHLVLLLQAAQDGDRGLDAGLVDQHLLEAALERGVLLDVLAVLVRAWSRRCSAARRAPARA